LFDKKLMLATSEGAAGGFEEPEAGILNFAEDWRVEAEVEIGLDEGRVALCLPVEAGEAREIGFLLDGLGRVAIVEA
jgi:hypothetical protein